MMNKCISILILLLASLVPIQTPAATLGLQAAGTTADGRTRYTITSVDFLSYEIVVNGFVQGQHSSIRLSGNDGTRAVCGVGYQGGSDCATPYWAYRNSCNNRNEAAALFRSAVGTVIYYGGSGPDFWQIQCAGQRGDGLTIKANTSMPPTPPPVSCTANDPRLTLVGKVGERLKGTTEWYINCTSSAALRLTISSRGEVTTTGGGTVLLTFNRSGPAVLNKNGLNPTIAIDGELTRSPTTAGTYNGSAVLLLEVL